MWNGVSVKLRITEKWLHRNFDVEGTDKMVDNRKSNSHKKISNRVLNTKPYTNMKCKYVHKTQL